MSDFFQAVEYVLDEASFEYLGSRHSGRGLLTWRSDRGFHLEILVHSRAGKLPEKIELGPLRVITEKERSSTIRMRLRQGRAVTPRLAVVDEGEFGLVVHDRLSIDLPRVFFTHAMKVGRDLTRWPGSALFDVGSPIVWPDIVEHTVELDGVTIEQGHTLSGLSLKTPTERVVGRRDGRHFEVHWSLDKAHYRRLDSWRFAEALNDALCVLLGRSVRLLEREMNHFPRARMERRSPARVYSLRPFLLFDDVGPLQKERLFALTQFFLKNGPEARTCRNIFSQLLRASRQSTWSDKQLLLSTILEATLRAFDQSPSTDRSWQPSASMARFKKRYLSDSWRIACHRAVAAFEHLRHPTAHPDWRFDEDDPGRATERARSLGDMTFLSHFYGYLILAMAGFESLDPIFGGRRLDRV